MSFKTAPAILAAQLAEGLEVIHREIVARQVQVGVLQRARVAVRQDEAVPVELKGTVAPIKVHAVRELPVCRLNAVHVDCHVPTWGWPDCTA